jgi:hypothetical protein
VKAPVHDLPGVRGVDRLGERQHAAQGVLEARLAALAEPGIERRRLEVAHGEPRRLAFEACSHDRGQSRLNGPAGGQGHERLGDLGCLLGRHVEPQGLDGHQRRVGLVLGAVHGTQDANTNLMQDPEGTEGVRCAKGIREIVVQRESPRPPDP